MTPADRIEACNQFNAIGSPIDVFLTSLSIASYGLNLQYDCHRGLILQYTWNINSIFQVIGRIVRIGQLRESTWAVLKCNGSYYDYQERKLCEKWLPQMLAEATIPTWMDANCQDLKELVAYEFMREALQQTFNKYSWYSQPPGIIEEYNSLRHRELGAFYGAAARILLTVTPLDKDASETERFEWDYFLANANQYLTRAADFWLYLKMDPKQLDWPGLLAFLHQTEERDKEDREFFDTMGKCQTRLAHSHPLRKAGSRMYGLDCKLPRNAPMDVQFAQQRAINDRMAATPSMRGLIARLDAGEEIEAEEYHKIELEALDEAMMENPYRPTDPDFFRWDKEHSGTGRYKPGVASLLSNPSALDQVALEDPRLGGVALKRQLYQEVRASYAENGKGKGKAVLQDEEPESDCQKGTGLDREADPEQEDTELQTALEESQKEHRQKLAHGSGGESSKAASSSQTAKRQRNEDMPPPAIPSPAAKRAKRTSRNKNPSYRESEDDVV